MKRSMKEEAELLKKAKKEEIIDHILRVKQVSGIDRPEHERLIREALESDFGDAYDKIME